MVKISEKRLKNYHKIYEQIYEDPFVSIADVAENTGLSRSTVSRYLQEMYADNILTGPSLCMTPHSDYTKYVYSLNFTDPFIVRRLKNAKKREIQKETIIQGCLSSRNQSQERFQLFWDKMS